MPTRSFTGRALAAGLEVATGEPPGAAWITYQDLR